MRCYGLFSMRNKQKHPVYIRNVSLLFSSFLDFKLKPGNVNKNAQQLIGFVIYVKLRYDDFDDTIIDKDVGSNGIGNLQKLYRVS